MFESNRAVRFLLVRRIACASRPLFSSSRGRIISVSIRERPMHDIVIRGGTIIDSIGKPAFTGDVAIAGGRIAAVGGKQGSARREIDADGLLVTPGWVDVHTHYDGQAM